MKPTQEQINSHNLFLVSDLTEYVEVIPGDMLLSIDGWWYMILDFAIIKPTQGTILGIIFEHKAQHKTEITQIALMYGDLIFPVDGRKICGRKSL